MTSLSTDELADAFLKWAYKYYHFDKVPPRYPSQIVYAIRVWLIDVRKDYSSELVYAIHRELARRGGLAAAKKKKAAAKRRKIAEERARQFSLPLSPPPKKDDERD